MGSLESWLLLRSLRTLHLSSITLDKEPSRSAWPWRRPTMASDTLDHIVRTLSGRRAAGFTLRLLKISNARGFTRYDHAFLRKSKVADQIVWDGKVAGIDADVS